MRFKRILLDDGLSTIGGATGVGNYSTLLYRSLIEHPASAEFAVEVVYRDFSYLSPVPRKLRRLFYLAIINSMGACERADIIHSTNYYTPSLKLKSSTRLVVTLHDMAAWNNPGAFSYDYLRFIRPVIERSISRADAVITVSHAVKEEVLGVFKIDERSVHVCHNALRPEMKPGEKPKTGMRYILFAGNIDAQKNLATLVCAFSKLKQDPIYKDLHLVIAGKKRGGYVELESAVQSSPYRSFIHMPGYVSDEELASLYRGAEAFVMTSVYEGFGIPIIEAMAFGTPVIASDIPVFREVAGSTALIYGRPRDEEMLYSAIDEVLRNETLRSRLVSEGLKKAGNYSPESMARRHMEIYASL